MNNGNLLCDIMNEKRMNDKLYMVEYLKGFSILTIVLMHLVQSYIVSTSNVISKMASIGGSGVHVFFVCSGFGLYLSYLRKPCGFFAFIKKRIKKVYIPYIIVVFISFLLPWVWYFEDRFIALLSHVFLFKMFVERYECSFGGHFWFISTIIQFYIVFIALCKLKKILSSSKVFWGLCLLISFIWWIFIYSYKLSDVRVWNGFFLQYLWEFSLGMCLAEYVYGRHGITHNINKYVLGVFAVLGVTVQTLMALFGTGLEVFNDIPAMLGYGSVALLLFDIPLIKKISIYLATISYEWYLLHILIFSTVFYFFNDERLFVRIFLGGIAFCASVCGAVIYNNVLRKIIYNNRGDITT